MAYLFSFTGWNRTSVLISLFLLICSFTTFAIAQKPENEIVPGAERPELYLHLLQDKRVGLVVNHTSRSFDKHLVDFLLEQNVRVTRLFAPEHGLRGEADAGDIVANGKDYKTGLPVLSLYGNKKKPTKDDLAEIDILVFDIQDVGCRFYTYISTLHYVMEAAAENNIPLIILDRPNPNGHFIDGPIMEKEFESFVGMHPVPVVYGMTIGEYGTMINGEKWIEGKCSLQVIPCDKYSHSFYYKVPVKPSPNLPDMQAILLYPGLCFFEGTVMSVGRGTDKQFQVVGHPQFPKSGFTFMPIPKPGAANPPLRDQKCNGWDFSEASTDSLFQLKKLSIDHLMTAYKEMKMGEDFFPNSFFEKLAGTARLRTQIMEGKSEYEIRGSWKQGLQDFNVVRKKYLLYEDF